MSSRSGRLKVRDEHFTGGRRMSSDHDSLREHLHEEEHSHGAGHSYGTGTHEHGEKQREHSHGHNQGGAAHGHTHGTIDPSIIATQRGLWAIKWSFIGLFVTTALQLVVVYFSGSIALLADTIHNLGDACTAIPLGIAFILGKRKPSKRFTYGYGRVEDLAGVAVVLIILASAIVAGYESIPRFLHPRPLCYVLALAPASVICV